MALSKKDQEHTNSLYRLGVPCPLTAGKGKPSLLYAPHHQTVSTKKGQHESKRATDDRSVNGLSMFSTSASSGSAETGVRQGGHPVSAITLLSCFCGAGMLAAMFALPELMISILVVGIVVQLALVAVAMLDTFSRHDMSSHTQ